MRALHRMNPARLDWLQAQMHTRLGAAPVRLLDVGCGAGLAAEALARRGHAVLGLDVGGALIAAARAHAQEAGVDVEYRIGTAEELLAEGLRFPVVTAFEVIEHVPDPGGFLMALAGLVEPGGILALSTLNRTRAAWAVAKLGAEYLLRMLPVGTHDWRKFLPPAELAALGRTAGLRVTASAGLVPDPITGGWRIGRNLSVNYLIAFAA